VDRVVWFSAGVPVVGFLANRAADQPCSDPEGFTQQGRPAFGIQQLPARPAESEFPQRLSRVVRYHVLAVATTTRQQRRDQILQFPADSGEKGDHFSGSREPSGSLRGRTKQCCSGGVGPLLVAEKNPQDVLGMAKGLSWKRPPGGTASGDSCGLTRQRTCDLLRCAPIASGGGKHEGHV
jgi:hypothetical protein